MTNQKTKEVSEGIQSSFIKIIKKNLIFVILIPFIVFIFIRFLEISFGHGWKNQLLFQYIGYIYVIGYSAYLAYRAIKNQLYSTLYFSIGWLIGLFLFYRYGFFEFNQFKEVLIIPIVFIILKIIFLILKKKKKPKIL